MKVFHGSDEFLRRARSIGLRVIEGLPLKVAGTRELANVLMRREEVGPSHAAAAFLLLPLADVTALIRGLSRGPSHMASIMARCSRLS